MSSRNTQDTRFDTPGNTEYAESDKGGSMNGTNRILEGADVYKLLSALVIQPYLFSYLEQDVADELEDLNYFDVGHQTVTAQGRDFLATFSREFQLK